MHVVLSPSFHWTCLGNPGINGTNGEPGVNGTDGDPGVPGVDGMNGVPGPKGRQFAHQSLKLATQPEHNTLSNKYINKPLHL